MHSECDFLLWSRFSRSARHCFRLGTARSDTVAAGVPISAAVHKNFTAERAKGSRKKEPGVGDPTTRSGVLNQMIDWDLGVPEVFIFES